MQERTKILVAGAAAGALMIAAIGTAAAGGGHGGGHYSGGHYGSGHGHGYHGGKGMRRGMEQFAKRYDTDRDGKISQQEIDTNRTEWHKKFDSDGNGTLSLKEFEALWLEAKRQRMVRSFQRFDVDGDGQMSADEYTQPMADVVERWDRDGDGVLSKQDRRHHRKGMRHRSGQGGGESKSE